MQYTNLDKFIDVTQIPLSSAVYSKVLKILQEPLLKHFGTTGADYANPFALTSNEFSVQVAQTSEEKTASPRQATAEYSTSLKGFQNDSSPSIDKTFSIDKKTSQNYYSPIQTSKKESFKRSLERVQTLKKREPLLTKTSLGFTNISRQVFYD